jgi:succinylglutamic semialdehyde dehydrogenase
LVVPTGKKGNHLLENLEQMIKGIQVKPWNVNPEGFMGPVIDKASGTHILESQAKAIDAGAKARVICESLDNNKALLTPGLLEWKDHLEFKQAMGDHEVFGPLLNCFRADSFEQAIDVANDTQYGLAAGLIAKSPALWEQFRTHIRAGITNWNRQITGAFSSAPFGGVGHSGNYRPSAYFAADYCSYPSASIEVKHLSKPDKPMTGLEFEI